jgi:hypothetical protein
MDSYIKEVQRSGNAIIGELHHPPFSPTPPSQRSIL